MNLTTDYGFYTVDELKELADSEKFDAYYEEEDCEHDDYMSAEDYERREYYRTHDRN